MNPAELATLQTVIADVGTAIQLIQAIVDFGAIDGATVLRLAAGVKVAPPAGPGPDVAGEYAAAKAVAEGKPAP